MSKIFKWLLHFGDFVILRELSLLKYQVIWLTRTIWYEKTQCLRNQSNMLYQQTQFIFNVHQYRICSSIAKPMGHFKGSRESRSNRFSFHSNFFLIRCTRYCGHRMVYISTSDTFNASSAQNCHGLYISLSLTSYEITFFLPRLSDRFEDFCSLEFPEQLLSFKQNINVLLLIRPSTTELLFCLHILGVHVFVSILNHTITVEWYEMIVVCSSQCVSYSLPLYSFSIYVICIEKTITILKNKLWLCSQFKELYWSQQSVATVNMKFKAEMLT